MFKLICVMVCLAFAPAAMAEEGHSAEIEAVISSQIDAFLADDFDKAFTYAAPSVRQYFGDSERFGQMVREGYPMVWRPIEVRFTELHQTAEFAVQHVLVRDNMGEFHLLEYVMVAAGDSWQINGVRILVAPSVGI